MHSECVWGEHYRPGKVLAIVIYIQPNCIQNTFILVFISLLNVRTPPPPQNKNEKKTKNNNMLSTYWTVCLGCEGETFYILSVVCFQTNATYVKKYIISTYFLVATVSCINYYCQGMSLTKKINYFGGETTFFLFLQLPYKNIILVLLPFIAN